MRIGRYFRNLAIFGITSTTLVIVLHGLHQMMDREPTPVVLVHRLARSHFHTSRTSISKNHDFQLGFQTRNSVNESIIEPTISDTHWSFKGMTFLNPHYPKLPVAYLIENRQICKINDSRPIFMLMYIHSSPEHKARRLVLRQTWANIKAYDNKTVRTVFLLGATMHSHIQEEINAENDMYHDIVQGNFIDSYKNLTYKAIMGLQWTAGNCAHAQHVLKADDDVFVNTFNIFKRISVEEQRNLFIMGNVWQEKSMRILREPKTCSKWCVSPDDFQDMKYYPRYCAGITFIMSGELIPALYHAARTTPFFWIDDMYVTGMLAKRVGKVDYIDIKNAYHLIPTSNKKQDLMILSQSKSIIHERNHASIRLLWDYVWD